MIVLWLQGDGSPGGAAGVWRRGAAMADYTAAYCTIVNRAGSAFASRSLSSTGVACSDGEDDEVFSSNDPITVGGGRFSSDGPVSFLGVADDGRLGLFERDDYFFFLHAEHAHDRTAAA